MKFIIKEEVGVTACATDDSEMDEEDGDEDEVLISWNLESQFYITQVGKQSGEIQPILEETSRCWFSFIGQDLYWGGWKIENFIEPNKE